jgi:hypothetical protein
MKSKIFIFLIGVLGISACCDDNGDCYYENPPPFFSITFDTSSIGFTNIEIENSFVTVIEDSSQITIDTIFPENLPNNRFHIGFSYNDEQIRNRDLQNHSYSIHITNKIDTIHNVDFEIVETVVECRQPCFPREKFDVIKQDFQHVSFDFNGIEGQSYIIYITK